MARICIWGDSITIGFSDYEKQGWVNRLRYYLNKEDFSVYNLGISDDTSEELTNRFEVECKARNPDVILFAIGTNDTQQINNNPIVSLDRFEKNLNFLINSAKKYTNKIGFIGLTKVTEEKTMPIPWNTKIYYDNKNLKIYDNKLKQTAENSNLPYLYMFDLVEDDELEDGLHPNSKGHEKMFKKVKGFLIENNMAKI